MAVKSTKNTVKYAKRQLNLQETEEWRIHNRSVNGVDVFHSTTGRVREEWVSDCKKERVLTQRLLEEVADTGNLEQACRRVISNKGCAGVDGMNVRGLQEWFNQNWQNLRNMLLDGSYSPQAVLEVEIPKLNVPTWRCWLVALSGKGWWRLSATPQSQEGMNLEWFKKIGLYDLEENYKRLKLGETAVYQQVRPVV